MREENQHWGSTLDDFLHEEGIYEVARKEAVIALNATEWAAFMAALEAPTKTRPRLEELLTTPKVGLPSSPAVKTAQPDIPTLKS